MATRPVSLANARKKRELEATLKKLHGPIGLLANDGGCGVSIFFLRYIERALDSLSGTNILGWSYPDWSYDNYIGRSITIRSRASDWKGVFLSCKRVQRDDIDPTDVERNREAWERFAAYTWPRVEAATREVHPAVSFALISGAGLMEMLGKMREYCVEYRQDKGCHLLFQEKPGTNLYLEIYLGHWMDESQFPEVK